MLVISRLFLRLWKLLLLLFWFFAWFLHDWLNHLRALFACYRYQVLNFLLFDVSSLIGVELVLVVFDHHLFFLLIVWVMILEQFPQCWLLGRKFIRFSIVTGGAYTRQVVDDGLCLASWIAGRRLGIARIDVLHLILVGKLSFDFSS